MARTADAEQPDRGDRSDRADRALRELIDADHRARDASVRRRRYWLERQAQETVAVRRSFVGPAGRGGAGDVLGLLRRLAWSGRPVRVVLIDGREIPGTLPTTSAADVLLT